MSVRDNKRNKSKAQQHAELANIQAMAEHHNIALEPIVETEETPVTKEIDFEALSHQIADAMNNNPEFNQSLTQVETDMNNTNVELDQGTAIVDQHAANAIIVDVAQPTEEPEGIAMEDLEANTANTDILMNWVKSLDKPVVTGIENFNIHTVTSEAIISALGIVPVIPTEVVNAMVEEASKQEALKPYLPMVKMIISTTSNDHGVDLAALINQGLAVLKPILEAKLLPIWDTLVANVESVIKPVQEAKPLTPAERAKQIQAQADAARAAKVTKVISDTTPNAAPAMVKTTAQLVTGEAVATVAMEHPEVILKRDFAHLVGTSAYFDQRASLYNKYHAWEAKEQAKRLSA